MWRLGENHPRTDELLRANDDENLKSIDNNKHANKHDNVGRFFSA
jgi:hypothetical protein